MDEDGGWCREGESGRVSDIGGGYLRGCVDEGGRDEVDEVDGCRSLIVGF